MALNGGKKNNHAHHVSLNSLIFVRGGARSHNGHTGDTIEWLSVVMNRKGFVEDGHDFHIILFKCNGINDVYFGSVSTVQVGVFQTHLHLAYPNKYSTETNID